MEWARVWPIVWQFGIGAVLCGIGLWCGIGSGYLDLTNRADRRITLTIIGGFLGLLALACAFTFWLPELGSGDTP